MVQGNFGMNGHDMEVSLPSRVLKQSGVLEKGIQMVEKLSKTSDTARINKSLAGVGYLELF